MDVGCGDGSLVVALSECGFKGLVGIDPFMGTEATGPGFRLSKIGIESYPGEALFDVIMMHHSFEHVEKPVDILGHPKRLLKDDGQCIIRITVADRQAFEQYRENRIQLDAPRHNYLHTNRSFELIAAACGMELDAVVNDSTASQSIRSEQYRNGIALNDPRSYFVSPLKKLFFNKRHMFSKKQIVRFMHEADRLNRAGRDDQRIYYLKKKLS